MSKLGTRRNDREPLAILYAELSGSVDPADGANFDFNTVITESDDASEISLDTVTNVGRITVSGGNVYELEAQLDPTWVSGSGILTYQWRDITAGAYVGKQGTQVAPNDSGGTPPIPIATAVVAPGSSNAYELWRVSLSAGTLGHGASTNAYMKVRKL